LNSFSSSLNILFISCSLCLNSSIDLSNIQWIHGSWCFIILCVGLEYWWAAKRYHQRAPTMSNKIHKALRFRVDDFILQIIKK
jgi:hypothetical protein